VTSNAAIWAIAAAAVAGVILRPWRLPEAVWAVGGALLLPVLGLLSWPEVGQAVAKGSDVYLFLIGMMLLSELARREGLFDHAASLAVRYARGSATALFALVYAIGVVITALMSNDATAVVLTPAVYAACKKAGVRPLPYLLVCALVANVASFVLPISNPANLVVFGRSLPPLLAWFERFALPSAAAITVTFGVLFLIERRELARAVLNDVDVPALGRSGRDVRLGIGLTAVVLLAASAYDLALGWPTFLTAALVAAVTMGRKREAPWPALGGISWAILPLVAGLFVLVEGLARSGVQGLLTAALADLASRHPDSAPWISGVLVAIGTNLVNNLPAGLVAASVVADAHVGQAVQSAVAIGIDLGPNLSVTGSLATILWLTAIRREGEDVTAWQFLRVGLVVMPAALAAALAVLSLQQ
jgi:arsenical pump membrane protein